MDGVTVLSEEFIPSSLFTLADTVLATLFAIGFLVGFIIFLIQRKENAPSMIIFALVFFVLAIYTHYMRKTNDGITRYEVMVDDSVSLNDFTELYKITDKTGEIYTVELLQN